MSLEFAEACPSYFAEPWVTATAHSPPEPLLQGIGTHWHELQDADDISRRPTFKGLLADGGLLTAPTLGLSNCVRALSEPTTMPPTRGGATRTANSAGKGSCLAQRPQCVASTGVSCARSLTTEVCMCPESATEGDDAAPGHAAQWN